MKRQIVFLLAKIRRKENNFICFAKEVIFGGFQSPEVREEKKNH
jgi:hypothetical protein